MKGIVLAGFMQNFAEAFDRAFLREQRYLAYLDGLKVTILISCLAILIGIVIGLIIAVGKVASAQNKKLWIINKICNLYTTVIRGTPVMVQLLIIYNLVFTSRDTNEILVGGICFGGRAFAWIQLFTDDAFYHHSAGD